MRAPSPTLPTCPTPPAAWPPPATPTVKVCDPLRGCGPE